MTKQALKLWSGAAGVGGGLVHKVGLGAGVGAAAGGGGALVDVLPVGALAETAVEMASLLPAGSAPSWLVWTTLYWRVQ
jgi:hypothetical protein